MTPNENEIDIDAQEDFEKDSSGGKPSLKEAWEGNPLMKIAAVVLGISVLAGGYLAFSGEDEDKNRSVVAAGDNASVTVTPGQSEVDAEYRKAIEEQNKQTEEQAIATGSSAIPTPIGTSATSGIALPDAPTSSQTDPLQEWRQRAEAQRLRQEEIMLPEEDLGAQPEVVPMVQPIRPQATIKIDPNVSKALADQMRVIITAQVPKESKKVIITKEESEYVKLQKEKELEKARKKSAEDRAEAGSSAGVESEGGSVSKKAEKKTIVSAGSVAYAQLLTELNSDIPGPALAQVLSGPFEGGRALGEFKREEEHLTIRFKRIIKSGVSYKVDGIALDEDTTLAAHQTDVDHHYFTRIILPAAAAFVEGYGSAVAETGTSTTTTSGGGVGTEEPEPDTREELFKGVEEASSKVSEIIDEGSDREITVTVARGTTMGILFMEPITTESVEK